MTQASNRTSIGEVCLEARIAAADLDPVRDSVERWMQRREAGTLHANGAAIARCDATIHLATDGGLSVFLRASGEDALRTLAWHGCDLVGALGEAPGEVALTWVRHPQARGRVEIVTR